MISRGWHLSRCVWVMDRGMNSEENRVILQKAGGHYILGEKLRDDTEVHEEVLSRKGRYRKIRENLEIKEVIIGQGERRRRFIIVHNPDEATRDRHTRKAVLKRTEEALGAPPDRHTKRVCELLSHHTMGRYLRRQKERLPQDRPHQGEERGTSEQGSISSPRAMIRSPLKMSPWATSNSWRLKEPSAR